MTGPEPDYVVIRAAPDLPPGFLPANVEGRWYDRTRLPGRWASPNAMAQGLGGVAVPSGRFETRDDRAVAEIYEVRP